MSGISIDNAIAYLRAHGYDVRKLDRPADAHSIAGFARLTGLNPQTIRKRLAHPLCPKTERSLTATGSVRWFRITPDLFGFLAQPVQPGRLLTAGGK